MGNTDGFFAVKTFNNNDKITLLMSFYIFIYLLKFFTDKITKKVVVHENVLRIYGITRSETDKAAENGDGKAMNGLAICYDNGKGTEKNLKKAFY
ncbi:hypothetical protein RhiirA1_475362 [Rhizophagus irregularis]|uniref:Uncharacterized protein n=1 Tax=Rhizophagus irregularis TaxID=588596 RepID=A0A2N0QWZ2_9GLOM|nr:hypothetical protein RhiirA1_475362 [Rhizophagus irregularis]